VRPLLRNSRPGERYCLFFLRKGGEGFVIFASAMSFLVNEFFGAPPWCDVWCRPNPELGILGFGGYVQDPESLCFFSSRIHDVGPKFWIRILDSKYQIRCYEFLLLR